MERVFRVFADEKQCPVSRQQFVSTLGWLVEQSYYQGLDLAHKRSIIGDIMIASQVPPITWGRKLNI